MYKLYGDYKGNWEQLDVSKEEKEIIDSLNDFINAGVSDRYMIKDETTNQHKIVCIINTLEDYLDYIDKYERKQVKKLTFKNYWQNKIYIIKLVKRVLKYTLFLYTKERRRKECLRIMINIYLQV